jgi:hypothetical protein
MGLTAREVTARTFPEAPDDLDGPPEVRVGVMERLEVEVATALDWMVDQGKIVRYVPEGDTEPRYYAPEAFEVPSIVSAMMARDEEGHEWLTFRLTGGSLGDSPYLLPDVNERLRDTGDTESEVRVLERTEEYAVVAVRGPLAEKVATTWDGETATMRWRWRSDGLEFISFEPLDEEEWGRKAAGAGSTLAKLVDDPHGRSIYRLTGPLAEAMHRQILRSEATVETRYEVFVSRHPPADVS